MNAEKIGLIYIITQRQRFVFICLAVRISHDDLDINELQIDVTQCL